MDRVKELETILNSNDYGIGVQYENGKYEVDLWCFTSGNMIGFCGGPDLVTILEKYVEYLGLTSDKREGGECTD